MTLGEKQRLFLKLLPKLLEKLHELGFEGTIGDGYRDPRVFGQLGETKGYGHPNSAHKNKLALDVNLFKNGVYLPDTASHEPLGIFWESLHPLCRWGGRFRDGNHYSLEHNGVK